MRREEIVTLEQSDLDTLGTVLNKTTTTERVVRELRDALNHGLDEVKDLRKQASVTTDQARQARDALQVRADRLSQIPAELVAPEVLSSARSPVDAAIALCDEILRSCTAQGDAVRDASPAAPPAPEWGAMR